MTIVPMVRVTVLGSAADSTALVAGLQALGVAELDVAGPEPEPAAELAGLLRWIAAAKPPAAAAKAPAAAAAADAVHDLAAIIVEATALRQEAATLAEAAALLRRGLAEAAPWGRFDASALDARPDLTLWFYRVPGQAMADLGKMAARGLVWVEAGRQGATHFIVVVAPADPALPWPRSLIAGSSVARLEAELAAAQAEATRVEAARGALARFAPALRRDLARLADNAALAAAAARLVPDGALMRLEGWAPVMQVPALLGFAETAGAAVATRLPEAGEAVPTLLSNPPGWRPGEALVRFFAVPAYESWDPSAVVLGSFALFFAVIVSDAGYGLLLLGLLALFWRRLGRREDGGPLRLALLAIVLATILWGVLVGTYAGAAPPHPLLARLAIVPGNDLMTMLKLSLGIGVVHLVLANLLAARRAWPARSAWGRGGWALLFAGAALATALPASRGVTVPLAAAGFALAVLAASDEAGLRPRLLAGLGAVPRLVSALGDTMSYMRLFALALAGTALASAFNALARDAAGMPGVGFVAAALVLALGHGLNLALSIASGVVHGLRLNYIEFFGWGLWGDGRAFRPFRRRAEEVSA